MSASLQPCQQATFNPLVTQHFIMSSHEIKQHFSGLTTRESEVMFFLIRGYSALDTAKRLGLCQSTVTGYIENIKDRWKLRRKCEIIERAIDMGYALVQPQSLG